MREGGKRVSKKKKKSRLATPTTSRCFPTELAYVQPSVTTQWTHLRKKPVKLDEFYPSSLRGQATVPPLIPFSFPSTLVFASRGKDSYKIIGHSIRRFIMPIKWSTAALMVLFEVASSAVVLPRPPSSSINHILVEDKLSKRTNQEQTPDPENFRWFHFPAFSFHFSLYFALLLSRENIRLFPVKIIHICTINRLLEIELQGPGELDEENLQGLIHTVLKNQRNVGLANSQRPPSLSWEMLPQPLLPMGNFTYAPKYLERPGMEKSHQAKEKAYFLNKLKHTVDYRKAGPTRKLNHRTWRTRSLIDQAAPYTGDDLFTTENSMVTSSELPKQIPAPPSKISRSLQTAHTTPVQRYGRTDILPNYTELSMIFT
ncbi:uncharacterized protein [Prorops nasuta]|uniref:uncharacterized protein n=1 Tax=Prorops nasuta TaxID=863751 RepID=UPI0034CE2BED